MDRIEALAFLNGTMDAVMTLAGKLTTDSAGGYGPALDRAFQIYITTNELATTVTTTDTDDDDLYCFMALLEATAYDGALPGIGLNAVDFSIDAPLSSVKQSQVFKQMTILRNDAWYRASICGFADHMDNVGGIRVNLDFNEPQLASGSEWS